MITLCLAFAGFALGMFTHALLTQAKVADLEAELLGYRSYLQNRPARLR